MDVINEESQGEMFTMLESLDLERFSSVYSTLYTLFAIFKPPAETIEPENPKLFRGHDIIKSVSRIRNRVVFSYVCN
jgi:hypothetical protein